MTTRTRCTAAAALLALAASSGLTTRAAVDSGVIRLAKPSAAAATPPESTNDPGGETRVRRGFDVEAFDSRFDGLWFQRKAYQSQKRGEDATRQSDLIREFVAEEGVRRLEVPAAALLLESKVWEREGSYDKALQALTLADALDPGRPAVSLARAHVLKAQGAGTFAAGAEWLAAARGALGAAASDLSVFRGAALIALLAMIAGITIFAALMAVRHQLTLRHDVEEWLTRRNLGPLAKAGGWAILFLPLLTWVAAGWLILYWFVVFFRYMRWKERALASLLLVASALAVPAYRVSVGLYGLAADPTVRTTLAAANGGYDPDRIVKLRELVDAHPDDPMYRFLLAGLYENGRYFEDAFAEYKRVLEIAPSTYQAQINLGNIYYLLGQYGEATSNYRQALELRPDSALAYYDMYLAQSESFKLKEASDSLAKARDIDPRLISRLLTSDSREGGGPKVVDAAIDLGSIWHATVEGSRLRQWLDGSADKPAWTSAFAPVANATSLLALAALLCCYGSLGLFRGHGPARRCSRCGQAFCPHCKSGGDEHDYCSQCLHLFVLGDGLAPETKSMKLYEVGRHETRVRLGRRIASIAIPGASHVLSGSCFVGFALLMLWILAWIGGWPEILTPLERALGTGMHWAGLRPSPIPAAYRLDAIVVLAVPLGLFAWLAGNVGFRKVRGA